MIVLDCSAGLEIAQNTPTGQGFRGLFDTDEEVVAPDLYRVEAANAAWKYAHAGVLGQDAARELLEDSLALPDRFVSQGDMMAEAFALAVKTDHSVYDMVYLVVARRNAATVVTCDRKLEEVCLSEGVDCIVHADF